MAARPFIYGTLSIALREAAAHDCYTLPEYPPFPAEAFKDMPELARYDNCRYMVDRERIAAASRVIPGWCGADMDKACSKAHLDRDQRIAQVTEVPEVFPFVVLDGKLFLASLASNEQALDSVGEDDLVEVIQKSATCLLVDDYDDTESNSASSVSVEVKIINGLVLVQYPLHLVTTLYLHTARQDTVAHLVFRSMRK
ncbi:hypothetical protein BCR44DRAFT_351581 [Catenaria anguillulae PL171]|uniref:Uncharacterized protein n=1 Tax=Catenaria anguillulae PL171 TaxID=765915 RepID=A0A1Y2H8G2_9FUNG|nr:hypothetical protein BCR44DRAFT_351581 [Catenaria anguillulae PL171]